MKVKDKFAKPNQSGLCVCAYEHGIIENVVHIDTFHHVLVNQKTTRDFYGIWEVSQTQVHEYSPTGAL